MAQTRFSPTQITVATDSTLTGDGSSSSPLHVVASGGGSGTPGGSDSHVQYNNGGTFGGESDFIWEDISKTLVLGGSNWYTVASGLTGGIHVSEDGGGAFTNIALGHSWSDSVDDFTAVSLVGGDRAGGTRASPTAVMSGMGLFRTTGGGYDGTNLSGTRAQILFRAGGNWTTSSHPTNIELWTTPSGSVTRRKVFTVGEDGNVDILTGKTYNVNGSPHTHTGLNLKNQLINGGFNFWQRITPTTATTMTDDTYNAPDRWYSLVQGAGATINRNAGIGTSQYSAKIIAGGTTNRYGIAQIIEAENSIPLRGQTVTAQCRIKPVNNAGSGTRDYRIAILEWTGTADTVTSELVADWTSSTFTTAGFFASTTKTLVGTAVVTATHNTEIILSVSGTVSTSCNNLIVFVWTEDVPTHASDYVLIGESGLYISSELQTWDAEKVSDEFARCLRYYEVVPKEDAGIIGFGQCYATTNAYVHLVYSEKRIVATPTIVNPTTDFVVANAGGGNVTVTSFGTTTRKTKNSSLIFPVTASGLVAGNATMLYGPTAKITIDAEL